ncbi:disulfide bond formation protein C [Cohnella xylanilytica]|uniref:Disulfide bond formation protein B n=1 Tax=Cohnella xylanilytica TaxID=557555 RepID=A0A841UC07_9BACL|nr:disulfide oxidoreductase [Cohnella xylanilytica]MBB6695450.1 disulfide bond formation protein B [Cohnella xylanilytica]GIO13357.1 disulfide bond formation protein C [Cohnella xylanilytica]
MSSWVRNYGLYFAWVVSLVATGGSLFLSEVMRYIPCDLCWFQRIFMYPLVLLLGRAALRDDRGMAGYALPLGVIGGLFSLYHYMEQMVPGMARIVPCRSGVPCNEDYLDWFGFITIPLLALIAFVLITVFLLFVRKAEKDQAYED